MKHAELRGREPDAEGVVHQLPHPLGLLLQRRVEALDRHGDRPQHGVAELAHQAQRGVAPGSRLGIELFDRGRIALGLDLDVVGLRDGLVLVDALRALARSSS